MRKFGLKGVFGALLGLAAGAAMPGTPVVTTTPPAEGFVGEQFCFEADLTNSNAGEVGFAPYYRLVLEPDLTLASASFVGSNLTINTEGVFPAAPGTLTDSVTGEDVAGTEGATLYTVEYPIGSVTSGSPPLAMELCVDVNNAAVENVLQSNAIGITPAFSLGNTATGDNGPQTGGASEFDFTPRIVTYELNDGTAEGERPPGPAWEFDIEACANIASTRTVSPLDFNTINPIVLPNNVQFVGPIAFTGTGVGCAAVTTPADLTLAPGGQIDINCTSGQGQLGNDAEVCATFPVYITDTLDPTQCTDAGTINTAKHVAIQKGNSGDTLPGGTRNYTFNIQISEFVPGISRLETTDILPDGLTFNDDAVVTLNGGGAIPLSGVLRTITNNTPGTGETTVEFDLTAALGTLPAAGTVVVSYSAAIDQTFDATGEPVLARDQLSNTVVADFDIDGAGNATNCSDNSGSSFTIDGIAIDKTLVSPVGGVVEPGDAVTFRLRMEIPSGDVDDIIFDDFFPLPVFDSTTISTDTNLATNPDIDYGPGDTMGLTPVSITATAADNSLRIQWPDVVSTSPQVIEVDVTATVSDAPYADNLTLSNLYQAETDNTPADAATALSTTSILVRAPSLALTKVANQDTDLEAGDVVTYTIEATNTSTAEAYEVIITDDEPAGLTGCTLDSTNGGSGAGGDSPFDVDGYLFTTYDAPTVGALDGGASVSVTVSCTIVADIAPGQAILNTASVTWTSQPGATPFTPIEAEETITAEAQPQPVKSIIATSETATPESTPRPLAIGEIARFRMSVAIPEGEQTNVDLIDLVPAGLQFLNDGTATIAYVSTNPGAITTTDFSNGDCVSGTLEQTGALAGITPTCELPAFTGVFNSGTDVTLSLGTLTNTETDADEEFILIELNVVALDDQDNNQVRSNRFRLDSDQATATSANAQVRFVEPELVVTKTPSPTTADAGDTITYTIQVEHTGDSLADAFDVSFTDTLDGAQLENFAFVSGPQAPASETCTAAGAVVNTADPFGAGITITFDSLPLGEVCEIVYTADLQAGVIPGNTVDNTGNVDYDTLTGTGDPGNTTGSVQGAEGTFSADDTASVMVTATSNSKTIDSTSFAHTPEGGDGTTTGTPRILSIGETVRYRLEIGLPEGNAPAFIITDAMPDGLQFVAGSARIAFLSDGTGITPTPGIVCANGGTLAITGDESDLATADPDCEIAASGGPFASGTDPVFDLGDVMNDDSDANDEFVILEYDALVLNEVGNQEGTDLNNSFTLSIDGNPAGSAAGAFTEIAEPQLVCDINVTPNPVDNRTDPTPTVSFTYTLTNNGGATAFQAGAAAGGGWVLDLPTGLENIASLNVVPTGDVFLNNTATPVTAGDFAISGGDNNVLTASGGFQIADGASLAVSFDVTLQAGVAPGDSLADACVIAYSGQATGGAGDGVRDASNVATGSGNDPITDTSVLNDYRDESTITLNTIAENPEIGIAKAITAGPINNGDGTYGLTYSILIENSGDVGLENIVLTETLATTFSGATFAIDNITVVSDSTTLTAEAGFTGAAPNDVLLDPAASTLPVGEQGTITIELTVTPGANLGPYNNTATIAADSDRTGTTVNDVSDDGTDPDSNGDGDPTNDGDPTPVTFAEAPELGIAKRLTGAPVNNGDGTYALQYELFIENSGDVLLDSLQVTDDLSATFAGVSSFVVDGVSSPTLAVNFPGYTGTGPATDLLDGTDTLAVGADATIVIDVTVTPGGAFGPFANQAIATADSPTGATQTDQSDDGTDPDGNGDGDPSNDSDTTDVTLTESPVIGLAKQLTSAPTNNGNGTYSLQYRFFVENLGDVDLANVQITDDLATVFADATGFVVDNVSSADFVVNFPGFTGAAPNTGLLSGTETLVVGASGAVLVDITVTPGADLGPYDNTATASGDAPSGAVATDVSDNGAVSDGNGNSDPTDDSDVTPVSFVEGPRIGLAKSVITGPTTNGDGTYTLTYRFILENAGDNILNDVNINEPLATTFAAADGFVVDALTSSDFVVDDANFDGNPGSDDLLAAGNSLAIGTTGSVDLTITVTPGSTLGPYNNSAEATGTSPANVVVTDTSDDGIDPDGDNDSDPNNDGDPTVSTFVEDAQIGVAKSVASGPVNNGDGTYTIGYLIRVENAGDVVLSDVSVTESLTSAFPGTTFVVDSLQSATLSVNPSFDGDGDSELLAVGNTLIAGAAGDISLVVIVTPGASLGSFSNSVTAGGTSPSGSTPTDDSVDGTSPDSNGNGDPTDDTSPTVVTLSEAPEIGLAKAITTGPVNNQDGTYGLTYTLVLSNTGDVRLDDVGIDEPLATTFAGATFTVDSLAVTTLTANPSFDGVGNDNLLAAGQSLEAGTTATVTLALTVTPGGNLGPYNNTATANGTSPGGVGISDQSHDGAVADGNGNGDPTDDNAPTVVTFTESPQIGVAKSITSGPDNNGDGTYTLVYTIVVSNSGDVDLSNVAIDEPLTTTFAGASFTVDALNSPDVTVNPVFDGEVESNLLAAGTSLAVGESATVTLALTVTPGGNLGPYDNLVVATGESPSGLTLTDDSVDGAIPDANGNGDPGDDTSPTSITFSETPSLGVAKSATVAEPNFDDTFTSTVTVVVENAGDVVLNDVQLDEPLGTNFAPAVVVSVDNLTVNGDIAAVRPGFDGVSETRLLADGQSLIAGGLATITFDVTVNLSVGGQCANIPLSNTVTGSGRSPSGQLLTDLSETGADPDPDGDANPGNNDAPTTIDFAVGVDGVVTVTEELLPGEDIAIQVVDADQNRNSAVADTVTVVIENLTSGESETLTLVETGVDSGVFEATLPTVESNVAGTSDDGQLNLFFLDNFTATYDDTLSSSGCGITVTDAGSATGLATLVGNVWLDTNSDDNFDVGENGLEGWIIELTDSAGNVIATVTVAADGSYTIPDIEPGEDFTITLRHPDTGTIFGQITDVDLPPDTTVIDQNLPVDPSGVFYDAVARQPIPGVDVRLVDANGVPLPAACLLPGQQPQTTAADGFYRFDVLLGADPACQSGDSFFIAYDVPDVYQSGVSELIPPIADPIDPTGLGDPVRVGDTPTTPQGADSTDYYLGFTLEDNDPDVIFNHIPIDPLGVETSSVRLTKRVARPTTTVGSLVVYTITIENLSPVTLPNIEVLDTLPPGFSYVDNSALLDGQQNGFTVSGPRPLVFASIALAPGQLRTLQYALRVGAGVTQGDYINTATPTLNGGPIGNTDQAEVQVIADPDFEETTIIGKVWHDRDADGWQDNADATGIQISGNPFGDGRVLPDLPGRDSEGENIERHQVELVMPFSDAAITVTTAEGSVVTLHKGEMTTAHSGDVEAGRNGQQIEVARERIVTERREVTRAVQQSNTVTLDAVIEPVRFESGKAAIPPDYVERLRTVLEELGDRENLRLSFVGHTDNQRLSARTAAIYADNQGLSESRARTVAEFLQRPLGLPATAIQTSGRGDRRPVASNATPEGMALNRRVEIQVLYDEVSSETLTEVEMIGGEDTGEMRVIVRNVGINEEGIAGVRLATVEGLIIETDSKGRYHIAAVDGGFLERGRNFIVKVDPATLPQGAEFTTENPRVKRITQGLLSQFDFGVLLPRHSVSRAGMRAFEFSPAFFAKGSAEVASEYAGLLENLVAELTAAGGGRVVVLAGDDAADRALATARGRLLREKLRASLPEIVWRNTEVYVLANSTGTPTARRPSTAQRVAGVLLGLFINTAHADEACTILSCNADGEPVVASQYLTTDTMMPSPGQDDTGGRFRIALPGAGVIWATEDAAVLTPRLSVEGPRVLPVGTRAPVVFAAYSNYHAFIDEYVLEIYRESDVDRVSPLARVRPVSVPEAFGGLVYFEWQPQPGDARIDERLAYELTVTGANGLRDQTSPGFTQVLSTQRYAEERDKAAERFAQREDARLLAPNLLTGDLKVPADEALRLLTRTWGRSQLVRQNILLTGARVRLIGDDLSPSHAIYVGGHQVPVDAEGDMAAEYLLPIGEHWAEVAVGSEQDGVWFKDIPVTVTGEHRFMVALADFTATSSDFSGALEPLSGNERFADDSLAEGRLAYYLKAKIKGKYLLTSQLDSREEQLSDILGNLDRKDSRTLFRRLDPDRYYPVYGDDSTTEWDADSLGRFYVRLDWNKSRAVWGNYQTEISDSEFIQYRRSLYGAQLSWNSVATTGRDETRSKLSVFASETQTALGHSEFLGTGGSLYYLRHIDILPGSDQARIEIRDADTNRVIENITLVRGRDYEVDELQGRIILGRPLLQIAEQSAPSIIKRGPLDGNLAILIVDYEYVPAGFDTNQLAAGGRAKQWFGDHLAVGGTYLSEGRGGEDYSLAGIDVTLAAGEGTYLKVEAASSEATQTERLFSTDGGLSFTSLTPANGDNRAGEAVGVESRINLQELGWTEGRTTAAAWWRRIDDQFSIARRDDGVDVVESGVELSSELGERAIVAVRASEVEREGQITDTDLAVQLDYRINDKGSVSAEVRQLTQEQVLLDQEIDATLAALRYAHQFSDVTEIYATGQVTLSNDDGQYDNNDLVSVGVTHQLTGRTALTGEVSSGHRGEGASMTLSHDVNADHTIYGTMTHSTDRTDNPLSTAPGDSASGFNASRLLPGNTLAIGHRSRISNQLDVFNETTFADVRGPVSLGHVFGLNWKTEGGYSVGMTIQRSDINADLGVVERTAWTLSGGYRSPRVNWVSRIEYRDDQAAFSTEDVNQWVSLNRFDLRLSEDFRLLTRLNYAETEDNASVLDNAKLVEGGIGLAYRPVDHNRINWLAKYTYLYDLTSAGQVDQFNQTRTLTDQRSHIGSIEGVRRFGPRWSLGGKLARRVSELRLSRDNGDWFESTTDFAAIRVRYHVIRNWDALAEYRFLRVDEAESERRGWLLGVDRHVGKHMKIGVGYNFTDFSDDLTQLDYEFDGFFLNVLGKY